MKYKIKLKSDGKIVEVESGTTKLVESDLIVVETEYGMEIAYVVPEGLSEENDTGVLSAKIEFIRKIADRDQQKLIELSEKAQKYLGECQKKIEKYRLPMQLVDADLSFDEKKLTFYFAAPERVDFRMLVSDLVHTFKKIIRLQQIGARDEARYLGGVGRCGQEICCKRFLQGNLESVTLDMAYDQNLAQMGSNRVTGVCGKLMCCLKYELDDYRRKRSEASKVSGEGKIMASNLKTKDHKKKEIKNSNKES